MNVANPTKKSKHAIPRLRKYARYLPKQSFVLLRHPTEEECSKEPPSLIHPIKKWAKTASRATLQEALAHCKQGLPVAVVIPGGDGYWQDGQRLIICLLYTSPSPRD